ncbi:MAG: hypothetical protein HQL68_09765 [Magnetococcales bacterium]|nr:hypothetical protein [Magnetococcales bacterium]
MNALARRVSELERRKPVEPQPVFRVIQELDQSLSDAKRAAKLPDPEPENALIIIRKII